MLVSCTSRTCSFHDNAPGGALNHSSLCVALRPLRGRGSVTAILNWRISDPGWNRGNTHWVAFGRTGRGESDMSEQSNLSSQEWSDADTMSEGGLRAPSHYGTLRKIWWWFDFLILVKLARLRFIAILALVGATILYWDTLISYYEHWTSQLEGEASIASAE